jgi:hypothetical protein
MSSLVAKIIEKLKSEDLDRVRRNQNIVLDPRPDDAIFDGRTWQYAYSDMVNELLRKCTSHVNKSFGSDKAVEELLRAFYCKRLADRLRLMQVERVPAVVYGLDHLRLFNAAMELALDESDWIAIGSAYTDYVSNTLDKARTDFE